jgi:uncharacterized protein YndB with AHSA1/START domain
MSQAGTLKVATPTDRAVTVTRVFDAPRTLVFEALIRPELVRRWLLGPPGWTMVVCEMDTRVGGAYRWVWRNDRDGTAMGMGGVFRAIAPPERLVATEKFDQAWYPGEAVDTTVLSEQGGKTTLTLTVEYQSREARDAALGTGMTEGMEASYRRLAALLATQGARGPGQGGAR